MTYPSFSSVSARQCASVTACARYLRNAGAYGALFILMKESAGPAVPPERPA
jgi:hypothetical protein